MRIPALGDMDVLRLPDSTEVVAAEALAHIDAEAVIVPAGCRSIGVRAFADCPNLKYVRFLSDASASVFL